VEAGLELLGTQGWAGTTVRGVCARASLTERYFYESFVDRDALLLAVFDEVAAGGTSAIIRAVNGTHEPREAAAAAFGAFVGYLTEDPRRGRVLLLEAHASEALQRRRYQALRAFALLAVEHGRPRLGPDAPSETDALLTALALVGGLAELLICWLNGDLDVPRERLVDHCAALLVAAAGVRS
jgi:AcrR family transcriptional regulator